MLTLVLFIILVALVFDFINGFHDAVNAIAPVVFGGAVGGGRTYPVGVGLDHSGVRADGGRDVVVPARAGSVT